jgi:membrane-associated protease RseP (regulator of RpoE activity)
MKYLLRLVSATAVAGVAALTPAAFAGSGNGQRVAVLNDSPAMLGSSSQGYLGIDVRDIDAQRAAALKLKEPAGAEIITVDHDAPAGTMGLKVHDVILQINGQPVAGVEQLHRMLHETPAGRTITLLISRDGNQQTVTAPLADRATIEQDAWRKHAIFPDPDDGDSTYALAAPSGHSGGNSFFGVLTFGNASVGVQLDTLGSQLADFFGVKDGQGLLVKRVAEHSPAADAGLKAGDVVTKLNGQTMATLNDWAKAIHANRGKQVQVTIFRNHKEETLSMQAGDARHKGELVLPEGLFDESAGAELNSQLAELDGLDWQQMQDTIQQAMQDMPKIDAGKLNQEIQRSMQGMDIQKLDRKKLRQQMDELQKNLQPFSFQQMY